MLKLKYYSLSKNEKRKIKEEFYQTEFGKNTRYRLNRLCIIGLAGILFSIFLYIFNASIWDIVTASLLLIASLVFIIASFKIRINKINDYLTKRKTK